MTLDIHDAFETAWNALEHGTTNVFITGKAGTGKSTFLNYLRQNSSKNLAVVAPTGVSALNVRGQTIHSFFGLDPHFIDISKLGRRRNKAVYKQLELLVIDEISMVRADIFAAIEKLLRVNGPVEGAPFGGVQICVMGDLFQLPPVVSRTEQEVFHKFYSSPYFFSSDAYILAQFELIKFDKVFRQSDNAFIGALNKIRVGYHDAALLSFLNQRVSDDRHGVTLCATNKMAEGINTRQLAALDGEVATYVGKTKGAERLGTFPAPQQLALKVGAQVMFTKNDPDKRWVNGSLGQVLRLGKKEIEVKITDGAVPKTVTVSEEKWATIRYRYDEAAEKLVEEETSEYRQFPLMLSWAVTIHKAQGKTLDHVTIDLGRGAFAPGQLYVALSRCRSYEHIYLARPIRARDVLCDPAILAFIDGFKAKNTEEKQGS